MSSDRPTHIVYNTGDEIWVTYNGDTPQVTRIRTHDGIVWDSSPEGCRPLDGGVGTSSATAPGFSVTPETEPSPRENPFFPMLREVMQMSSKKKLIAELFPLVILIGVIAWLIVKNNHC